MEQISHWVKKNRWEFLLLVLILLLAAFFRFYKIPETFYFISDAGRDAQTAFKILFDHKLTLIGPRASVAGFFLGPFYFYLIILPLWLFKMDPLGLAYFASFLGVLAVFLIWLVGRELFGLLAGLTAAFLAASSPIVINHSRMAWNPSPVSLFTLLLLLSLILFGKTKQSRWLTLGWGVLGLGVQLHYTFIYLLLPFLVWLLIIQKNLWRWLKGLVLGLGIFLLLNSPLVIFDFRHNFLTSQAFFDFLFGQKISFSLGNFFATYTKIINEVFNLTIFSNLLPALKVVVIFSLLAFFLAKKSQVNSIFLLLMMVLLSVLPFSFFKETIQLYYYNFLLPFPLLLVGALTSLLNKLRYLVFLFLIIFFWSNLKTNLNPPRPPRTLAQIKKVSLSIVEKVSPEISFNIAAFSDEPWYTAEEYRYFTYYFGRRAAGPEDYKNIQKLFVISSKPMENPLAIQSQETADFGARQVEASWEAGLLWIFQLSK